MDDNLNEMNNIFLKTLNKYEIQCYYTTLPNVTYFIDKCSMVFIGASSIFLNGNVLAKSGSSLVALIAKKYKKPFYVLCQSIKFSDRILKANSLLYNHNGNKEENREILKLEADIIHYKYISVLITDYGLIPATSVPVILREFRNFENDKLAYNC